LRERKALRSYQLMRDSAVANSKLMKILLVITKAEVGGAQTSVLNLAREMKARGHEIAVGAGDGDWLPRELAKEKIPFIRFKNLKRSHNPLVNLFFIWEMKKFLHGKNFDVVHFNSSNALFGAIGVKPADRKIKTVFTFRGMSMLDEHYQKVKILKFIYFLFFKFCLLFIDAPVFVSRENLEKFGQGKLVKNGKLIYNGLDPKRLEFLPREESRVLLQDMMEDKKSPLERGGSAAETGCVKGEGQNWLQNKYIIGSIGRLDYAKNYEFLINVMPKILKTKPEAIAIIIGGGPEEKKYRALVKAKNLEDKFFLLGNIPNASRFIKGFDLFVLPSRYEGLSITLIEALFAGTRILTTQVGGNKETVGGEEELFNLNDQTDFLNKFKKLQDFQTQVSVDINNQNQSQNFLLAKIAGGYEEIYK
jgi:glycosyltransferase involved in cell wall biosynthesis